MAITTQLINSDGLIVSGIQQTVSFVSNSFTTDTCGGVQFPTQQGVPFQAVYRFKVIPAAVQNDCVVANITPTAAGFLPLRAANVLAPSGNITYASQAVYYTGEVINLPIRPNFTGGQCVKLDCERVIAITWGGLPTSPVTFTIAGWDYLGRAVSETLSYPGSSFPGNGITFSKKAYSIIGYIYVSGAAGLGYEIGTNFSNDSATANNCAIGLPYFLANVSDIISASFDLEGLSVGDITPGNIWRTTAPSITSASARGLVSLPTDVGTNGIDALVVYYLVYGADSETNSNLQNLYQSTLVDYHIAKNASEEYVYPYLTPYDLVGMQYPGNQIAYNVYASALLA